jgi:hypothetical protein
MTERKEVVRAPENLDFVISQLAVALRAGWYYGYIGDDGRSHNILGDALSHLRNYRTARPLGGKQEADGE